MEEEKVPISPNIETETVMTLSASPKTNGIGKFKVLYRSENRVIALGPDYYFFLPAFSIFLIGAIFLFKIGLSCSENIIFRVFTLFVAVAQPLSYLACALINPGVVTESVVSADQIQSGATGNVRYCKDCNIYVNSTTRHCEDCQLCIDGYDHHCPWVSKCIGKYNLRHFYVFVVMTPIFMLYLIVCTAFCFADFEEYPHTSRHTNHHG